MSNKVIPYINQDYPIKEAYANLMDTYYWSDDFSPGFYVELAKAGFISTSVNYPDFGDVLLPELQEKYAVLDFENLHISTKVKKLLKTDYKLESGINLDLIIEKIAHYHGDECWLTTSYIEMLYGLTEYYFTDNFKLETTILYKDGEVTAGELGYYIGKTYTSLTGFYNKKYNNYGKLQLVLLAQKLKEEGIKFWNMGHPYMQYKIDLGANILTRAEFLNRWLKTI